MKLPSFISYLCETQTHIHTRAYLHTAIGHVLLHILGFRENATQRALPRGQHGLGLRTVGNEDARELRGGDGRAGEIERDG